MKYLKVRWPHTFNDEPALIYSELDDLRFDATLTFVGGAGVDSFASIIRDINSDTED